MTIDMSKYRIGAKVNTVNGVLSIVHYDDIDNTYLIGESSTSGKWVNADGTGMFDRGQFVLGESDISHDTPSDTNNTLPTSPEYDNLVKLFDALPDRISAVIRICDSSGNDSLRGLEFSNGGGVSVHQLVVKAELISIPNKVFNRCDYQE